MPTTDPTDTFVPLQLLDLSPILPANAKDEGAASEAAARAEAPAVPTGAEETDTLPSPANPVTDKEVDAFLADRNLRPAMMKVIRGRVPDADVEDVVQVALWGVKRAKRLPKGEADRRRYALAIARNQAKTWHVRKYADQPEEVAFEDGCRRVSHDGGIERAIEREHLQKLTATVPDKQRSTFECLGRYLLGENLAEIAREMGLEYDTLYKRVTKLHRDLMKTGHAIAGLALVLLLLMGIRREREVPVATPPTEPAAPNVEQHEPAPRTSEAKARAATLREEARAQCDAKQWKKCVEAYDLAAALDPEGETQEVKAAHERALEESRR
jgi:RNA polymerase sigma factor (sigma-70 family)